MDRKINFSWFQVCFKKKWSWVCMWQHLQSERGVLPDPEKTEEEFGPCAAFCDGSAVVRELLICRFNLVLFCKPFPLVSFLSWDLFLGALLVSLERLDLDSAGQLIRWVSTQTELKPFDARNSLVGVEPDCRAGQYWSWRCECIDYKGPISKY